MAQQVGLALRRLAVSPARMLAALFVLYATIAALPIAALMPPFQAADELNHAERAYQVGSLVPVASRFPEGSGGVVPSGLSNLAAPFESLRFHPHVQVDAVMNHAASRVGWGQMRIEPFPNTAIYPPVLYVPAGIGLHIGRSAGLSVWQSVILARLLTAAASIALAASAILLAGPFAPMLFAVLCLPMSMALFAAISQDGPMIGCAALGGVLLAQPRRLRGGFVLGCLLLSLVVMARPAYLPFCLAPLLSTGRTVASRLTGAALVLAATLLWSAATSRLVLPIEASRHIADQIAAIRHDPSLLSLLVHTTLHGQLVEGFPTGREFVGVLGWLDTTLPGPYYVLTAGMLVAALAVSGSPLPPVSSSRAMVALTMIGASIGAIFLLQYLSWSRIGGGIIEGVQGRYFLPLAPFLILAVPQQRQIPPRPLLVGLCAFPLLSVAVTLRAILVRYYFG